MKKCLINYCTSEGREGDAYMHGTKRLIESAIQTNFQGDILVFSPALEDIVSPLLTGFHIYMYKELPTTVYGKCLSHQEAPYQFKSFIMQFAKEQGYEQVLWMDSCTLLNKNPQTYFDLANEIGIVTFDNARLTQAIWTSDDCLETMGCSVERARTFNQVYAAVMLFDFTLDITNRIFEEYIKYCMDGICLQGKSGSSRPEFKDHRHDQSIFSFLVQKYARTNIGYGGLVYSDHSYLDSLKLFNPTFVSMSMRTTLQEFEEHKKRAMSIPYGEWPTT